MSQFFWASPDYHRRTTRSTLPSIEPILTTAGSIFHLEEGPLAVARGRIDAERANQRQPQREQRRVQHQHEPGEQRLAR